MMVPAWSPHGWREKQVSRTGMAHADTAGTHGDEDNLAGRCLASLQKVANEGVGEMATRRVTNYADVAGLEPEVLGEMVEDGQGVEQSGGRGRRTGLAVLDGDDGLGQRGCRAGGALDLLYQ